MNITLRLPYPPSINKYWRTFRGRHVISAKGKQFREDVLAEVLDCCRQPISGRPRLAVSVELTMPDRRKRDIDNTLKALIDALEAAGIFEDDEQIDDLRVKRLHVEPPGCADVVIQEIQEMEEK